MAAVAGGRLSTSVPVFYDCEASCIGGLPIEIGWADPSADGIRSEGHLIKPPSHWEMVNVWDPDAAKLHRISLELLAANGKPPFTIARRMNEALAVRELFSDAPGDDEHWLRTIFGEADSDPSFTIRRTHADVLIGNLAVARGWTLAAYEAAKEEAARLAPRTHRAEADARHLALLWQTVSQGPKDYSCE
jgi:hypothetical protein